MVVAMKKYLIVFLFSFCFAQQKTDGRFQIIDLGTDSLSKVVILLDSQTGQCWKLTKDSISVESPPGLIFHTTRYIWIPVYFDDEEQSVLHTLRPTIKK